MTRASDWSKPGPLCDVLIAAADVLTHTRGRTGCRVDIEGESLLISGDLHDNLPNFNRIIHAASLEESSHHLLLQELIHGPNLHHGCDMSWRMLARVATLITTYPDRVHPLLGNHENSQLMRVGVTKGGGNSVEQFEEGLVMSFGEDWEDVSDAINLLLAAMPLAVRTPNGVQCSHALPDHAWMSRFDADVLDRVLSRDDRCGPFGDGYQMTWGRRFTATQLADLGEYWGVEVFVIGHLNIETASVRIEDCAMAIASDSDSGGVVTVDLTVPVDRDTIFNGVQMIQTLPLRAGVSPWA